MISKRSRSLARLVFVAIFATVAAACQTPDKQANDTLEAKRRHALERQKHRTPPDEAQTNLWRAQENALNRDSNPVRSY